MLRSISITQLPPPNGAVVAALAELTTSFGLSASTADTERIAYARDMWPLGAMWGRQGRIPPPPDAVVWPKTVDEVCALVQWARRHRVALVPFGAGTGVCGGTWALEGGVMVDLKRFDSIAPVEIDDSSVEVGAGVFGDVLERRLNTQGFTSGHFPASMASSTVGGWLATRSAGQCSSKYGQIEDLALSVSAVLGTGEPLSTPRRPHPGPALASLLIGSEGTLCLFTGAQLRVFPLAEERVLRGLDFPSVDAGLGAVRTMFRHGLRPAVVLLNDPFDTALSGQASAMLPSLLGGVTRHTVGHPRVMNQLGRLTETSRLVLMFEGPRGCASAELRAALDVAAAFDAVDRGEAPGVDWLAHRFDEGQRFAEVVQAGAFADAMDVAAGWDRVTQVYAAVRAAAEPLAFVRCRFSHAGPEGCALNFFFVGAAGDERAREERHHSLWRAVTSAATSAGANLSHHHGVGLLKARAFQDGLGEGRHVLASLKSSFDPDRVLNAGKLGL